MMLSVDTNLLLHAYNEDSPQHHPARDWLHSIRKRETVAISELVLVELYALLRNPAVLVRPLAADEATDVIRVYRSHPRWRLIGFPAESKSLHDELWERAGASGFAFRRVYDARTALTLIAQGVTEFATANVKDFRDVGFDRVWNPIAP